MKMSDREDDYEEGYDDERCNLCEARLMIGGTVKDVLETSMFCGKCFFKSREKIRKDERKRIEKIIRKSHSYCLNVSHGGKSCCNMILEDIKKGEVKL
jgi:hypothetical protein